MTTYLKKYQKDYL